MSNEVALLKFVDLTKSNLAHTDQITEIEQSRRLLCAGLDQAVRQGILNTAQRRSDKVRP